MSRTMRSPTANEDGGEEDGGDSGREPVPDPALSSVLAPA